MNKDQATPRPWHIEYGDDTDKDAVYFISGQNNKHIIETDTGIYGPKRPDAELIVRAVNNFDELVEALKKCNKYWMACVEKWNTCEDCRTETGVDTDDENLIKLADEAGLAVQQALYKAEEK